MTVTIRMAKLADAAQLLAIYQPYVEETAISFEYQVPSLDIFKERLSKTLAFYPFLVVEEDNQILGYAYASPFHVREAYAWSAEVSIYLGMAARGKGLGRALYQALEDLLREMGILNLNACIASSEQENSYISKASPAFHEKSGYQLVGKFHKSGYKFGQWFDMIWMEKIIGQHDSPVKTVTSIHEVLKHLETYSKKIS
ncbi:GNAT family N-acetyltransferase [Streptococcus iniae]|uniref:N-acetyltransferase n=1 Tax=Streptococcus iniae TaxID=1346 RepID=A0A3L8GMD8_STRIN|nr:GNAT family N-acetyltransferase [Streptococcus iniae]AGM98273.1 Phosphinothricin N-acetyltransferase [Streptococcus iniae SF1]AHY15325.1 phosphinothricin acetyltransferase [Streptococcus iniae]AHY17193.1 phosphinothricin acetyltransferase [Streptococcus iniae]AJG25503.1 phosphinothricin acetyltransferase [Streptococcus iniae]APD31371.1 phosphinothricin acetyltransferase [Streptococcus iniae]